MIVTVLSTRIRLPVFINAGSPSISKKTGINLGRSSPRLHVIYIFETPRVLDCDVSRDSRWADNFLKTFTKCIPCGWGLNFCLEEREICLMSSMLVASAKSISITG